jgi:hypothetical protein
MNEQIKKILSAAYGPCPGFSDECQGEMRWAPLKGHAPRGFCGGEGQLGDIEVIFVFAEPGDPLSDESHPSIDDAISCARDFFENGIDLMHKNVRFVMDLLWPDMSFDEQMKKCLFTDSVLCSAPVERGAVSWTVEQACVKRYFLPLLELLPNAKVIAFGRKAQNRLSSGGFVDYISARAVAPPEGNKPQARESWIEAVQVLRGELPLTTDSRQIPVTNQTEASKPTKKPKTPPQRNMKGHRYVSTEVEAINQLKNGYFIDAKRNPTDEFQKRHIFPFFLNLLTDEPTEYPVNYISFLNCEGMGDWQSLVPNAMSGAKGFVHDYCRNSYETLVLHKKGGQIIINEGKKRI